MPDTIIATNKKKEAIYEYGIDLSSTPSTKIELHLAGNKRRLVITENQSKKVFELKDPKKPNDTPSTLMSFGNFKFIIPKEIAKMLSNATEKGK